MLRVLNRDYSTPSRIPMKDSLYKGEHPKLRNVKLPAPRSPLRPHPRLLQEEWEVLHVVVTFLDPGGARTWLFAHSKLRKPGFGENGKAETHHDCWMCATKNHKKGPIY